MALKKPQYSSTPLLKHGDYVAPEVAVLSNTKPEGPDHPSTTESLQQLDKHQM